MNLTALAACTALESYLALKHAGYVVFLGLSVVYAVHHKQYNHNSLPFDTGPV